MRGTKILPVENLKKIHKAVLKKFKIDEADIYKDYIDSIIKKSDFNKKVSETIYPSYKDNSWFTRFESGLSRAEDFLAKYWSFHDLNQPILEYLHEYAGLGTLDAERISRYNSAYRQNQGNYISNEFFQDLEFNREGIEINCIAADLGWLTMYRDKIVNAANKNNSSFKYLMVNPQARLNLPIISQSLQKLEDKNKIQIRDASSNIKLSSNNEVEINTHDILFPLDDDIVIYKNIPLELREHYNIGETILAAGTDIFDKSFERRKQDFIIPDKTKLDYVQIWFDTIWNACG